VKLYPQALRQGVASGHELADHMWEHQVPREPRSKPITCKNRWRASAIRASQFPERQRPHQTAC